MGDLLGGGGCELEAGQFEQSDVVGGDVVELGQEALADVSTEKYSPEGALGPIGSSG